MWSVRNLPILGLLAVLLASCGEDSKPGAPPKEVGILDFAASASSIAQGEKVALSWQTENASSVHLFVDSTELQLGSLSVAEGSAEVEPQQTTTFRLVAQGIEGDSTFRELTVTVVLPAAPTIESFTATPERFGVDGAVSLSWKTRDATSISITDGKGRETDVSAANPLEGTVEVVPDASTTYTLKATGPGGSKSATASVTLVPKPEVTLSASKLRIDHGASTTLSWETKDAAEARLFVEGEEESPLASGLEGSWEVSPEHTTTYVLEAEGDGGTSRGTVTISVVPMIDRFVSSVDEEVRVGSEVELLWTIRGGRRATIVNGSTWTHEIEEGDLAEGSVMARVGPDGTFTLKAFDEESESQPKTTSVRLTDEPRIMSTGFEPADGVTAGRGATASIEFSWVVDGAELPLSLEKIPGGAVEIGDKNNQMDSVEVTVEGPMELRLTARNASGEHVKTVPVPVVLPAQIESFHAVPSRVGGGETVELRWSTRDAASVELKANGVAVAIDGSQLSGQMEVLPAADTTYVLRAINRLGVAVTSEPVEITIGEPMNLSFTAGQGLVRPDAPLPLSWTNLGGTSLQVLEEDGSGGEREVCAELAPAAIAQGGCEITAPSVNGRYTYRIRITNLGGTDEETLDIWVSDGPLLTSFFVSPMEVTEGDAVRFSWVAEQGLGGELPSLQLKDQDGTSYDLSAADPMEGQESFALHAPGDHVFTLSVPSGNEAPPSKLSVAVKVHGLPLISSFTANPVFADADAAPVTLSWTTAHGGSLEIVALDRASLERPRTTDGVAICTKSGAEVTSGSCVVHPTIAAPDFRLRLRNPLGVLREMDLQVGVYPAKVTSFTASATQIIAGESITLAWTTERADSAELGPAFREISEPFIDARTHEDGTLADIHNMGAEGGTAGWLKFPTGFKFPYFGIEATHAWVCQNGALAFNKSSTPGCGENFNYQKKIFPSNRDLHLAPFYAADVVADPNRRRESALWSLLRTPDEGPRSLVIQFADYGVSGGVSQQRGSLNFEVILYEDGSFEYRYGEMSKIDEQDYADGKEALIAYQSPGSYEGGDQDPRLGHNLVTWSAMPGGLSFRSFRMHQGSAPFAGAAALDGAGKGQETISPTADLDISLVAKNDHSSDERSLHIQVYPGLVFGDVAAVPANPRPNETFDLTWNGAGIETLTIKEGATTIATLSDPAALAAGRYAVQGGLSMGVHSLTLQAQGHVRPENQKTQALELLVDAPFELSSFGADTELLDPGSSAVLSWTGSGLDGVELVADPGGPVAIPGGVDLNAGSSSVSPSKTTTYRLVGKSLSRSTPELVHTLIVRSAAVNSFEVDKQSVLVGGSITLSWATGGDGVLALTSTPPQSGLPSTLLDNDSVTFTPSESGVVKLCRSDGTYYQECKEVRINVAKPGSMAITEVRMGSSFPAGEAEWFEVRNFNDFDVDLQGMDLILGCNPFLPKTIGSSTVIARSGGYKVFSSKVVANADAYVWPEGLCLQNTVGLKAPGGIFFASFDTTQLAAGGVVAGQGKSIHLSGDLHFRNTIQNPYDDGGYAENIPSWWCAGDPTPGTSGPTCNPRLKNHYDVEMWSAVPFYDLRELEGTSVPLLTGGNEVAKIFDALPFDLTFFGQSTAGKPLYASSMGQIGFGPMASAYWDAFDTDVALVPYYQQDLQGGPGSSFHWVSLTNAKGPDGTRMKVVGFQWTNYGVYGAKEATFQVQIWESGDLVFSYKDLNSSNLSNYHTVGVQGLAGPSARTRFFVPSGGNLPPVLATQSILFRKK